MEETMDAKLLAQAENLRQTVERLSRVGLIVDRACLSAEQRRAIFAWQQIATAEGQEPDSRRSLIGFAYPNAR